MSGKRRFFASICVFVLFACGGDGCSLGLGSCASCSSCSSCDGCDGCALDPIPEGFPIAERVDNAAQLRLTSSGFDYLEGNLDAILESVLPGMSVAVPATSFDLAGTLYTVCPDEDCAISLEIRRVQLDPIGPNRVHAEIDVRFFGTDDGGAARDVPLRIKSPLIPAYTCQLAMDSARGSSEVVTLVTDIDLAEETRPPRDGYTWLDADQGTTDLAIENDDIHEVTNIFNCPLRGVINGLGRTILLNLLGNDIPDVIHNAAALCTARGDGGCTIPGVAVPDEAPESTCRYGASEDDDCVQGLLGIEGQGDLGAALGSVSPGLHARLQVLFAAGRGGESVADGVTLGFFGGMNSLGHDSCVPVVAPPPLPTIPDAPSLRGNTIFGSDVETHLGVALAEGYLDQVGYGIYDSGMLCLGVGTSLDQRLSSGLFSLFVRSLENLTFPERSAALAIILRPQGPPDFTVGAGDGVEPLLTVAMPLEADFYVWSSERYIRFMTYAADVSIPLDLDADMAGLVPRIGEIGTAEDRVFNDDLLDEDSAMLATSIGDIIRSFAGMIAGAIDPIALPELAGLRVAVPEGGILGFEEAGHRFVGLYADLEPAPPAAFTAALDTTLIVTHVALDPEAHQLETWGRGAHPEVQIEMATEAPSGADVEYSYRVDGMPWSRWSDSPYAFVSDRVLLFQARHRIEARARVAGAWRTTDPTPASAEVLVDFLAPRVALEEVAEGTVVDAFDHITSRDALEARLRHEDGPYGAWMPLADLRVPPDGDVEVEVRDEAGNIGSARSALIRGLPNPAGGGCACGVTGAPAASSGLLAFVVVVWLGRRRRHSAGT